MKTKTTKIDERFWRGSQSAEYRLICALDGGVRVRVHVKRDSYDAQSFARCDAFSSAAAAWNPICDLPYPQMASVSARISHGVDDARIRPRLEADAEELLAIAGKVLG